MSETIVKFEQKEVSLSKGTITYQVGGSGPSILYLHSAGGQRISSALEELAKSFRIYTFIFPGFDGTPSMDGVNSMKELANLSFEFIQKEIGSTCDVIGHSFGGWVATWLAVLHPEAVEQLVLETPAGFRPEGKGGLGGDPEVLKRRMYAYPERVAGQEKPADIQKRNREMVHAYHKDTPMDTELVEQLEALKVLTLILAGTKDGVIPVESGHLLKRKIPNSYLMYIDDAAHNPEIDQPERFVRVTKEFLSRGEAFLINWKNEAVPTQVNT